VSAVPSAEIENTRWACFVPILIDNFCCLANTSFTATMQHGEKLARILDIIFVHTASGHRCRSPTTDCVEEAGIVIPSLPLPSKLSNWDLQLLCGFRYLKLSILIRDQPTVN